VGGFKRIIFVVLVVRSNSHLPRVSTNIAQKIKQKNRLSNLGDKKRPEVVLLSYPILAISIPTYR